MNRDFTEICEQLRNKRIDVDDPFMQAHRIIKVRQYNREIPDWAMNDVEVRALLLRSFPKLNSSATQRALAARWASVIYMYYRMQYSHRWIAAEMGITVNTVSMTIRSFTRAQAGQRANGKGVLGGIKGRPRKRVT